MPISKQTLDFLIENRIQNSRDWFHNHKDIYQKVVLAPFTELSEKLGPTACEIDPLLITTPKVGKTISRIYRDTRYSKDKSLYRDVMWCVFTREKKEYESPLALFVEASPMGFRYGCGYWQMPTDTRNAMRELILSNDPAFKKAKKAFERQSTFKMEGDFYKRSRFADQPEQLRFWLDRKEISFICCSKDFDLLFSENFYQMVAEGFLLLKPIYDFFRKAESHLFHP